MKLNRFKILVFLVIVILLIILIPNIKNKIMYYKVRDKFLAAIYEVNRNGNFHIVENVSLIMNDGNSLKEIIENYGKNGITYSKNTILTEMNGDEYNTISHMYFGLTDTLHLSEAESKIYGGIIPNDVMDTKSKTAGIAKVGLESCKFSKIEKGTYKGKDCYVIEAVWEDRT